jgi:hypothetical protein
MAAWFVQNGRHRPLVPAICVFYLWTPAKGADAWAEPVRDGECGRNANELFPSVGLHLCV